ncbi:hypothetical protein FOCC_FOCC005365 [Frankliniella occidentalis]|uniref:Uncharacterized protein LOC113215148 isoform X1 n=1 Tax=Frankliniella occidentalis TaxID=133901 RepID=A0A6J1TB48_FRAOC|nr:uncharacterized protein LOC113215148 isoform X1 [Frankliniella occidentalis]KAE8747976.1 hypothetical protein FOCC_FOCC005365 [Frankliniella occidentalis]
MPVIQMRKATFGGVCLLTLLCISSVSAKGKSCLQFSWLGPNSRRIFAPNELVGELQNHMQLSNRTCAKYPKPKPIPCIEPFLVNELGYSLPTLPNGSITVADTFNNSVLCDPGIGDICAVVAFLFNEKVVNLTAYCTRVTLENSDPLTYGCVAVQKGTYRNVVCVCDPQENRPCHIYIPGPNSSTKAKVSALSFLAFVMALLINGQA